MLDDIVKPVILYISFIWMYQNKWIVGFSFIIISLL